MIEIAGQFISAVGAVLAAGVGTMAWRRSRHADNVLKNGTTNKLNSLVASQRDADKRLGRLEAQQAQLATNQTSLAALISDHLRRRKDHDL